MRLLCPLPICLLVILLVCFPSFSNITSRLSIPNFTSKIFPNFTDLQKSFTMASKTAEELNKLLMNWKRDGLLKVDEHDYGNHGIEAMVDSQKPLELFKYYPQHPHYNGVQLPTNSLVGLKAFKVALWVEFMDLLKDVADVSRLTPTTTIVEKIGKAERLRDEVGFDVSIILARLNVVLGVKKRKLEDGLIDLEESAPIHPGVGEWNEARSEVYKHTKMVEESQVALVEAQKALSSAEEKLGFWKSRLADIDEKNEKFDEWYLKYSKILLEIKRISDLKSKFGD